MAIYGCKRPMFVPIDTTATPVKGELPTYDYENRVIVGHLVQTNETINRADVALWGDNKRVEHYNPFTDGQLDVDLDDIRPDVVAGVFGYDLEDTNKVVTYSSEDEAPWGCYSFLNTIQRTADNGVVSKIYKGMFYPKVKGTLQGTNSSTKTDTINFQTQKIIFAVDEADNKQWCITAEFDDEDDCLDWLDEMSGKPSGSAQTTP